MVVSEMFCDRCGCNGFVKPQRCCPEGWTELYGLTFVCADNVKRDKVNFCGRCTKMYDKLFNKFINGSRKLYNSRVGSIGKQYIRE